MDWTQMQSWARTFASTAAVHAISESSIITGVVVPMKLVCSLSLWAPSSSGWVCLRFGWFPHSLYLVTPVRKCSSSWVPLSLKTVFPAPYYTPWPSPHWSPATTLSPSAFIQSLRRSSRTSLDLHYSPHSYFADPPLVALSTQVSPPVFCSPCGTSPSPPAAIPPMTWPAIISSPSLTIHPSASIS